MDDFSCNFKMNLLGYHEISARLEGVTSCSYLKLFFFYINLVSVELVLSRAQVDRIDFGLLAGLNSPGEFVAYLKSVFEGSDCWDLVENFRDNLKLKE